MCFSFYFRKDVNGIFAFPVTDQIAPGYSNIIKDSMDFSTIRNKIDNNEYDSVSEYIVRINWKICKIEKRHYM